MLSLDKLLSAAPLGVLRRRRNSALNTVDSPTTPQLEENSNLDSLGSGDGCQRRQSVQLLPLTHQPLDSDPQNCCSLGRHSARRRSHIDNLRCGASELSRWPYAQKIFETHPWTHETEEAQSDSERDTCVICLDARAGVELEPCSHDLFCEPCAGRLRRCPLCRAEVSSFRHGATTVSFDVMVWL